MNAHVPTPEQRAAVDEKRLDIHMDIEAQVNDLARHCRAMHVVADSVFDELRIMDKHLPATADAFAMVREDFEVLEAQISDAYIMSRDLRTSYYGEVAQ